MFKGLANLSTKRLVPGNWALFHTQPALSAAKRTYPLPPKKVNSLYATYIKYNFADAKEKLNIPSVEVMGALSKNFKALKESELKKLKELHNKNLAKYETEYEAWKESLTPEQVKEMKADKKKLKKKKEEKADPNLPKRPLNYFLVFTKELYEKKPDELLKLPFNERGAYILKAWNELSASQQQVYHKNCEAARKEYFAAKEKLGQ